MDTIFDRALIAAHRHRALANNDPKAAFLLDIAAEELADGCRRRTYLRDRRRTAWRDGHAARAAMATGKIGTLTRVESEKAVRRARTRS